jgi:hypothetical protein
MPRVRFTIRWMMAAVAIVAVLLGLIAYREKDLPSLDETGGGFDSFIVVLVDVGIMLVLPALLLLLPPLAFLLWILHKANDCLYKAVDRALPAADSAEDQPDPE